MQQYTLDLYDRCHGLSINGRLQGWDGQVCLAAAEQVDNKPPEKF